MPVSAGSVQAPHNAAAPLRFPIKERVVTVGDGYFLTFSIQHFLFSLYEKSWYLTVTDCHSLLF